jgi:hypothetical protein
MSKLFDVAKNWTTELISLGRIAARIILTLCRALWRVLRWRQTERLLLLVGGIMVLRVIYRYVTAWLPPVIGPYLFWGTLLILVGSVASVWPQSKRRIIAGARIAVLALGVTVGGLLTTRGWNELNDYYREQGQLVEVALEWKLNDMRAEDISFIWSKHGEIARASVYLYPKPSADAARRAIDIRRLDRSELNEAIQAVLAHTRDNLVDGGSDGHAKATYTSYARSTPAETLFLYCEMVDVLNQRLDAINRLYTEGIPPQKLILKTLAETFGKDGAFEQFTLCHQAVGEWLKAVYPELLEQAEQIRQTHTVREFSLPPTGDSNMTPTDHASQDPNNGN